MAVIKLVVFVLTQLILTLLLTTVCLADTESGQ